MTVNCLFGNPMLPQRTVSLDMQGMQIRVRVHKNRLNIVSFDSLASRTRRDATPPSDSDGLRRGGSYHCPANRRNDRLPSPAQLSQEIDSVRTTASRTDSSNGPHYPRTSCNQLEHPDACHFVMRSVHFAVTYINAQASLYSHIFINSNSFTFSSY